MNTATRSGSFSQRWLKHPDEPRELDPLLLWPAVALLLFGLGALTRALWRRYTTG